MLLTMTMLLVAATARGAGDDRLRVDVYPSYAHAPAVVRIQAHVAPDADNRALEIGADSGSYFRATTIELTGTDDPRAHTVEFRGLPAGEYDVQVLLRTADSRVRATLHYRVVVIP